jgi:site-specific recombinase XerD
MTTRTPPSLQSTRLLDQVRERARYLHYSLATEKAYLYWVRFFIRWHGLRHPRDMGAPEVESFLTMLATQRRVSSSTHNQALSGLLFLYREVLAQDLPWMDGVKRPSYTKRIPVVLTREEVSSVLAAMVGDIGLVTHLLYGTGMRLMEGLRLRVKDVDFDRHVLVVRQAKGNKDRVVMLPRSLEERLRAQMQLTRAQWQADRDAARGGVEVPHALEKTDPRSGVVRRHHLLEDRLHRAIKKAVQGAGMVKNVSAHTLRHSFATPTSRSLPRTARRCFAAAAPTSPHSARLSPAGRRGCRARRCGRRPSPGFRVRPPPWTGGGR